jgi:hypothetical protein
MPHKRSGRLTHSSNCLVIQASVSPRPSSRDTASLGCWIWRGPTGSTQWSAVPPGKASTQRHPPPLLLVDLGAPSANEDAAWGWSAVDREGRGEFGSRRCTWRRGSRRRPGLCTLMRRAMRPCLVCAEASSPVALPQQRPWMRAGQQAGPTRGFLPKWKGSRRRERRG